MNTEKLLRLADLMETIAPEKFDLGLWSTRTECGTVCCAVGHACLDRWFRSQGFGPVERDDIGINIFIPSFRNFSGFDAVEQFFGLTNLFATFLFVENSYVTHPAHPSEVAIRIRLFVEHHDEKVVRELESV